MILFYDERQVAADMFIKNLSLFLDGEVIQPFSLDDIDSNTQPKLLIVEGQNTHPRRLYKIAALYPNVPMIVISDKNFKNLDVTGVISTSTPVKQIADICCLILQKTRERKAFNFNLTEEMFLKKLVQGASNREISRESGLASSMVKYHLQNIYSKMGVKNRTQAAIMADKFIL